MCEILFRGKRIDNGEWAEGYYFAKAILEKYFIQFGEEQWMVDPSTIGQYTGLTDKNGTKIFEGDIVKALQNRIQDECRVGYENGAFVLYPQNGKIYERTLWEYWYNDWDVEVIGNIHDNPEKEKGQG